MNTAIDELRSYLGRTAGMRLAPGDACQAESRLAALLRAPETRGLPRLLAQLDPDGSGPLARELIEALTCRETWFFRDRSPFIDFVRRQSATAGRRRATGKPLRVWSAGCASGQETYSLAICLRELAPLLGAVPVELLGTDISQAMVERARQGGFSDTEIQRGLPVQALLAHVDHLPESAGRPWRMRDYLRGAAAFQTQNLLGDCSGLGLFDVIFCRNVLTGLHLGAQRAVIANIAGQLADGGYLVLGQDEEPWSLSGSFAECGEGSGIFERRQFPLSRSARASHLRLVASQ